MTDKLRLAVVSPFLDQRHGTERRVSKMIEWLAATGGYCIHLYSQRVEDLQVPMSRAASTSALADPPVVWCKVPTFPGPHLLNWVWWFWANQFYRWADQYLRGTRMDLVFSPGVNCLDANVVSVNVLFTRLAQEVKSQMRFRANPVRLWPRLLHRRLYYALVAYIERWQYTQPAVTLVAISHKTRDDLERTFRRTRRIEVVYHGLDSERFQPAVRSHLRPDARRALRLGEDDFALLMVGNDWRNKGLGCLLAAVARLADPRLRVLVVGRDNAAGFQDQMERLGLRERVRFLPPRADVELYYAAADAYVGASLEDAFALPPAEAMASGLPTIVSRRAGASELVTDGKDALVLENPEDADELASLIQRLLADSALRTRLAHQGAELAAQFTWDRAGREMNAIFRTVLATKQGRTVRASSVPIKQ